MPWRQDTRGYYVLVSELMLQQTQVDRVIPKFEAFIERFPNIHSLAAASLADVLGLWSGLGYNRRAKYLHQASRDIVAQYDGDLPQRREELVKLPGIGPNTAGAILVYAYNLPEIFIETNIRTVLLHHFFQDQADISDRELQDLLVGLLDREDPRGFYWALMDYGTWLKKNGVRNISASRHYRKQSPLSGSVREVRGQIIRALTKGDAKIARVQELYDTGDSRFEQALAQLEREGLLQIEDSMARLTN